MDLTNFIYDFNLATTCTTKDVKEECQIINEGRNVVINYDNCVSLYDIVERFNNSLLEFGKDKKEFKKILSSLGEKVVYGFHTVSDEFTCLSLDVYNPAPEVFDESRAIVKFIDNDGTCYASANNGRNVFDQKYKSNSVQIDEEDVEACLGIVNKHDLFLESFRELQNKFVFGNGTTVVFTKIDDDILGKVTTFTLTFGNAYMNTSDFLEVKIRLGEHLEVLYGKSGVLMQDEEIKDIAEKKKIIDELLRGFYVNSDKLCVLYKG